MSLHYPTPSPSQPPPRPRDPDQKIVLIDLPFMSPHRPNLALSLLKSSLKEAGFQSSVRYAKLDFARRLGLDLYRRLSHDLPHEALIGDFIFAEMLDGIGAHDIAVAAYRERLANELDLDVRVPADVWAMLPALRAEATQFLHGLALELKGAHLVGLNATFEIAPSVALAKVLKEVSPATHIVLGGGHCEGEMGATLHQHFPWIDFVCRGEGEELVVQLVSALEGAPAANPRALRILGQGPGQFSAVRGLIWREEGRSVANGESAVMIEALDSSPLPDYSDWLEQLEASRLPLSQEELSIPFESSRGCWYGAKVHCTFCGLNGPTLAYRSKSAGRVMQELREIARLGVRNVDAVDNILDMKYFDSLLPMLAGERLELSIFYEIKANLTRQQVARLAEAKIFSVQPGIESLSSSVLKLMRKGAFAYQNIRLLKWLAEYGVSTSWNILYGFPYEDHDEFLRMADTLSLLTHLQPPQNCLHVLLNRFSPLFDKAEELGVRSIRPVPGYREIFGRFCPTPEKLAYYFAYDGVDAEPTFSYVEPAKAVIRAWQEAFGRSAFTCAARGDSLYLFDRRAGEPEADAELTGGRRRVFEACDAGASAQGIARETGLADGEVAEALEEFASRRWVVHVDDRYLSLPVDMTRFVPEEVPLSLLGTVSTAMYRARMQLFRQHHQGSEEELTERAGQTVAV